MNNTNEALALDERLSLFEDSLIKTLSTLSKVSMANVKGRQSIDETRESLGECVGEIGYIIDMLLECNDIAVESFMDSQCTTEEKIVKESKHQAWLAQLLLELDQQAGVEGLEEDKILEGLGLDLGAEFPEL